jgi:hypothetical protein
MRMPARSLIRDPGTGWLTDPADRSGHRDGDVRR